MPWPLTVVRCPRARAFDQPDLSWAGASGPSSADAFDRVDTANLNPGEPITRLEPLARDEAQCWEVPDWEQQMERATLTAEPADQTWSRRWLESIGPIWPCAGSGRRHRAAREGRGRETCAQRLEDFRGIPAVEMPAVSHCAKAMCDGEIVFAKRSHRGVGRPGKRAKAKPPLSRRRRSKMR